MGVRTWSREQNLGLPQEQWALAFNHGVIYSAPIKVYLIESFDSQLHTTATRAYICTWWVMAMALHWLSKGQDLYTYLLTSALIIYLLHFIRWGQCQRVYSFYGFPLLAWELTASQSRQQERRVQIIHPFKIIIFISREGNIMQSYSFYVLAARL